MTRKIVVTGLAVVLSASVAVGAMEEAKQPTLIERNEMLRKQLVREREQHEYLERIAAPILHPTPEGNRALARAYFGASFSCADEIIRGESNYDHLVWNRQGSGAYGLGQARPRSKMLPYAYAGLDPYTNPMPQLVWFSAYSRERYGSVCGAAAHWNSTVSW